MKNNIYFSQDPNFQVVSSFYQYVTEIMEKNYDQNRIIEWINTHENELENKKVWLLTGHAYTKTYDEWESWVLENGYDVVIDCRGFGQVLIGESKFRYNNLKSSLENKGVQVYSLSRD